MLFSDPFHEGERKIQERTGERSKAIVNGRMIAGRIPANATTFLAQLSYCLLGWESPEGDVWSSFLTGQAGFATCDKAGTTVTIRLNDVCKGIPPFGGMRQGDPLGLLFIDLATRRRLRVNGPLAEWSEDRLLLTVAEAFPNCPKFIQRRNVQLSMAGLDPVAIEQGDSLTDDIKDWLSSADTLFVASAYPGGSVDVSHRGGNPGFVRLENGALRIPDYPGNSMFGTLGNFAVNPHAGLVFLDFVSGRQLQLTGDVRLDLDAGESAGETGGTGRWWEFKPRRWFISSSKIPFDWTLIDNSPFNP